MITDGAELFVRATFAENSGLTEQQLFQDDPTLNTVILLSPGMTNSVDLMEAFARTSNSLRREYGVRVRLPALPLDTPISQVLSAFLEEFERQQRSVA